MAAKIVFDQELIAQLEQRIKDSPHSLGELARELHTDKNSISEHLEKLRSDNPDIAYDPVRSEYYYNPKPRTVFGTKELPKTKRSRLRALGFSESHLGGLHAHPHLIYESLRSIAVEEKPDLIIVCGDIHNGLKHKDYARGNNILNTAEWQMALSRRTYSSLIEVGIPVFIISGDHDMWQWTESGIDMVGSLVSELNAACVRAGKQELFHYLTPEVNYQFEKEGIVFELLHPVRGATRGLSYGPQTIYEDRVADFVKAVREDYPTIWRKPHVICYGQWHREIVFYFDGVLHILVPGLQSRTGWEHDKGLIHQVGAWLFAVEVTKLEGPGSLVSVDAFELRYIDLWPFLREKRTLGRLGDKLVDLAYEWR